MKTPLDIEIRSRIAAVLAENVQLSDFYHWLGPFAWGIKAREHPEAARLTYAIEHLPSFPTATSLPANSNGICNSPHPRI